MAAATETQLAKAETVNALRNADTQQKLEDLQQLTASNQKLMQAETPTRGRSTQPICR